MEKSILISRGDLQVFCKWTAPEEDQIKRIVIGVHGIGGCTDDAIQRSISEEMEMYYCATFRFDFPNHGRSPLVSQGLTLENCRNSLLAVAEYARKQYPQVEDLCIFATGFGAYITLVTLEQLLELPGKIKLVIQTPSFLMGKAVLEMNQVSEQTLWAMDQVSLKTPRPIVFTYDFYTELRDNPALNTYPIPILILTGEADDFVPVADIENFRRINPQSKLVVIPGAKHRFLEEGAWDMVLDLTRDWFEFEQVLLADWS